MVKVQTKRPYMLYNLASPNEFYLQQFDFHSILLNVRRIYLLTMSLFIGISPALIVSY